MRISALIDAETEAVVTFYRNEADAAQLRNALNAETQDDAMEVTTRGIDLEGGDPESDTVHAVIEDTPHREELIAAFAAKEQANAKVDALIETDARNGILPGAYSVTTRALHKHGPGTEHADALAYA